MSIAIIYWFVNFGGKYFIEDAIVLWFYSDAIHNLFNFWTVKLTFKYPT